MYILSGKKDILFPLLQCFSMLTNIWLIYNIARKIGCRKLYAYLAAFLFYTSPSAFGEALTTQVDQFASVWLIIFVYYYLDMISFELRFKYERKILKKCIYMGLCIVWGYLTKPSVLVAKALLVFFYVMEVYEKKRFIYCYCKIIGMRHSGHVYNAFARINEECYLFRFSYIADCRVETVSWDRKTIVCPG